MTVLDERMAPTVQRKRTGALRSDTVLLAVVIAIVPNLLFLLISPWFLIRRVISPVAYLVAGLLALFLPWPFALLLFAAASAIDVFFIFAYIFDMSATTTLAALQYASTIDIKASLLYLGVITYFAGTPILLTCLVRRYKPRLRAASPLLAAAFAFGIAALDYQFNGYKPINLPPFESAMQHNGLTSDGIIRRDRNLMVVIVEGMGAFADPRERSILSDRLQAAASHGFRLATGTTHYYGSTTGAESRELCGKWGTFVTFLKEREQDCLPERLGNAGYRTISYHASTSDLFSRREWYPRIGIQQMNFEEDIERDRPGAIRRKCGSVFLGLCDADIGDMIRADMLKAGDTRSLYYWLTLDSHLPYAPVAENPLKCQSEQAAIKSPIPCELTEIWGEVFDKVAAIARDPNTPPLDIVVVGDHNTPMWSRDAYRHFVPGKVDWYYLEDQRPVRQASLPAAASD